MMDIRLSPAAADDADSLIAIQQNAFKRLYDIYKDEGSPYLRGAEEFNRWLAHPAVDIYKILADGVLCGGIAVLRREDGECYLARLYILPALQSKGIASKAISLCEELYPAAKRWTLDFPVDQIANKRCYEKAGYTDTGIREKKNDTLTLAIYEKNVAGC